MGETTIGVYSEGDMCNPRMLSTPRMPTPRKTVAKRDVVFRGGVGEGDGEGEGQGGRDMERGTQIPDRQHMHLYGRHEAKAAAARNRIITADCKRVGCHACHLSGRPSDLDLDDGALQRHEIELAPPGAHEVGADLVESRLDVLRGGGGAGDHAQGETGADTGGAGGMQGRRWIRVWRRGRRQITQEELQRDNARKRRGGRRERQTQEDKMREGRVARRGRTRTENAIESALRFQYEIFSCHGHALPDGAQ